MVHSLVIFRKAVIPEDQRKGSSTPEGCKAESPAGNETSDLLLFSVIKLGIVGLATEIITKFGTDDWVYGKVSFQAAIGERLASPPVAQLTASAALTSWTRLQQNLSVSRSDFHVTPGSIFLLIFVPSAPMETVCLPCSLMALHFWMGAVLFLIQKHPVFEILYQIGNKAMLAKTVVSRCTGAASSQLVWQGLALAYGDPVPWVAHPVLEYMAGSISTNTVLTIAATTTQIHAEVMRENMPN